ncbi:prolyl oligopeptidase family serine peptidase [Corynebacterium sp. USCH3]|uniref:prolyl oligopeptidase family serine peptidase n=1 Tax=Corynebacterium sp. USCH3 TaxID=3024840 RepID=UPI0030997978
MAESSDGLSTRERILEAARHISSERGMRAVTVRAVSDEAGVGMGTLRHYFKSQRELFATLVGEFVDDRVDDSVMDDTSLSGPDRLSQAVGQFLPADYADKSLLSAWFDVYATAFAQPPSEHSRQLLEAAARRSHAHARAWLTRLASEGWLDATRIDDAANMLLALSSGLLLETLTPGSPITFENAKNTLSLAVKSVLRSNPAPLGQLNDEARSRFLSPTRTLPVSSRQHPERAIFVSNESGTFQVYAWNREDDTRWQITDTPTGTYLCAISPDGNTVWSFQDGNGSEKGYWHLTPFPKSPGKVLPARSILNSEPGMPVGHAIGNSRTVLSIATADGSAIWVVDDPTGDARERHLRSETGVTTVYAMDAGEELVVIGSPEGTNALRPQIIVLRISDGSEVSRIWDGVEGGLEVSGFAPAEGDNRLLMTHERGGIRRPFIWNIADGERIELNVDLPGEVWARWYPDGTALLLAHTEKGRMRLYRYVLDSADLESLNTRPGWVGTGAVRSDGKVDYLWCDAVHPPEHRVLYPDGTEHSAAQEHRQGARSRPVKDAFIALDDEPGESLHILFATPDDEPRPYPTVFMIHGGPYAADEDFYSPTRAAWLDAGFAVVHVNYRGSTGYGRRWRDAIIGDPGRRAVSDIARARAWAIENGLARHSQCFIEGWSWGGYLALLSAGLFPRSWAACIAGAPIADYRHAYEEQPEALRAFDQALFEGSPEEKPDLYAVSSPVTYASNFDCPILILHGRNDPRAPAGQIESFTSRLREQGKPYEIYEFDAGHGSLDTAEFIRQTETEIAFALGHLLLSPSASASESAGDPQRKRQHT